MEHWHNTNQPQAGGGAGATEALACHPLGEFFSFLPLTEHADQSKTQLKFECSFREEHVLLASVSLQCRFHLLITITGQAERVHYDWPRDCQARITSGFIQGSWCRSDGDHTQDGY